MSSTDFWEKDPQLYWAYRTFYLKKNGIDAELTKYDAWLNGNIQSMGTAVAIAKTIGNDKQIQFPEYDEVFTDKKEKELSPEEQFNYWARR